MTKHFIFFLLLLLSNVDLSISNYIRICNHGVYLAKCYFESQRFTYELQIQRYDTGLFPILQCSKLEIPFDAIWYQVECKALAFIAVYKRIFIEEYSSGVLNTCYTISGTILDPTWSQTRC
ncbi:unnamed protein product [Adineta steineri]|uniref:Uncharacterized protein n=1 Tax=Adineta steineri TaxID=433720 RepID=A0A819GVI0_9BILA|nr:unnamed protein product [Adineta steineri]CAF3890072.1 unnamed protein product [Adineta steineri]